MGEMCLNDFESLIRFCKIEYPENIAILYQEIDKLCEKILVSLKEIALAENSLHSLKKKTNMVEYGRIVANKEELIKHKDLLLELLEFVKPETYTVIETEGDEETEDIVAEERKIDYNDAKFKEDNFIAHSLYEDFLNTLPCGFEIEGNYFSVYQWKDMLIKLCEYLNTQHRKIFLSFVNDDGIQGRSRRNFAKSQNDITKRPYLIPNSGIYIETNHSANCIRNLIIKMLDRCGIPKKEFKIFLNKNYKSIHIKDDGLEKEDGKKTVATTSEEVDIVKIGQYARNYFKDIIAQGITEEELSNFQNKEWSKATFGIDYPLLKKIEDDSNISEEAKNEYGRRYWVEKIEINGNHYLLCSQWHKKERENYLRKIDLWSKSRVSIAVVDELSDEEDKIADAEENADDYIRIGKQQNSFRLPCVLVSNIFKFILESTDKKEYVTTSEIREEFSDSLSEYYDSPMYAVGKLMDYLISVKAARPYKNYQKKKYEITDKHRLEKLSVYPKIIETGNWNVHMPTVSKARHIYIVDKSNKARCPYCDNKYTQRNIEYNICDSDGHIVETKKLQTKLCTRCKKHFITEDTYKTNSKNLTDAANSGTLEFVTFK